MNYNMRKPCDLCPFTRTGLRLSPERAQELGGQIVDIHGQPGTAEFICHKTADEETEEGHLVARPYSDPKQSEHCAGALIFAEKQGVATQLMRFAERLRLYDPSKLDMKADVFDNLREMIKVNRAWWTRGRRKRK